MALIDVKTSLLLNNTWTDLPGYVFSRSGAALTITTGRADETAQMSPSSLTGQLDNRDFRFTSRNPTGPYYPYLTRNTPIRVSVPDAGTYLRLADDKASSVVTSDTATLRITGTLDVAIDCQPDSYEPCMLAYKWGGTAQSWQLELNGDGTVTLNWFDGSASWAATSTVPIPHLGRIMIRATLVAATGTVTFNTAATMAGGQTQLGATVVTAATALAGGTGQVIRIGRNSSDGSPAGFAGQVYEFRLYSGAGFGGGGTLEANPIFTSQSAGATSFSDAQANTWTMNVTAELSNRSYRFHGELSSLPIAWDTSGQDIWVPFQAGGVSRRLGQGKTVVLSSIRRAVTQLANVLGYWPAEDGTAATQIASGIPGGQPMSVAGTPGYAGDSTAVASAPLAQLNGSVWQGAIPAYTPGTTLAFRFVTVIPNSGSENNLVSLATSGTAGMISVQCNSGNVFFTNINAGTIFLTGSVSGLSGQPVLISAELVASGGNITPTLRVMTQSGAVSTATTAAYAGSIGSATVAYVNIGDQTGGAGPISGATPLGHVWVENSFSAFTGLTSAFTGHAGETAGNRFSRLCGENNVRSRIWGFPNASAAMGPQGVASLLSLLQDCETADNGLMYEPRECLGLGYRTLASMLSQTPALTLDYSLAQAGDQESSPVSLTGIDDDQRTRNDITVTRSSAQSSGSSYEAILNDGTTMSVTVAGSYPVSVSVNVQYDTQLPDAAGWLLHTGTVSEERYPQVVTGLHRAAIIAAGLGFAIQNVRIGDYVAIINPPAWLPPGTIKQVITGAAENLTQFLYQVSWNAIPESPYETGLLDDAVYGRCDTDGSTLNGGFSSGATSLSVATTTAGSPLWTTSAGDFPFDINIAGEQITVTNITGASSPQTFTVTRSVNGVVKAQLTGADVRLFHPTILALA